MSENIEFMEVTCKGEKQLREVDSISHIEWRDGSKEFLHKTPVMLEHEKVFYTVSGEAMVVGVPY